VTACSAAQPLASQTPDIAPASPASPTAAPVASPSLAPSPTLGATVADTVGDFTFRRPADWQRTTAIPTDPSKDQALFFLANFPLITECAVPSPATPQPSASAGQECLAPFGQLPEGAAFVEIYDSLLAGPLPNGGEPIQLAGLPSRMEIATPGRCGNQIADEVLIVPIPEPPTGQQYHLSVVACLREPNLDANDRAVRAFIASLKRR